MTQPAESAEFNEQVEDAIARAAATLADGFDVEDIAVLIKEATEVADQLDGLTGPQKREVAELFAGRLIDRFFETCTPRLAKAIEDLDIPFLPEAVERVTVDPILKSALPRLLRPLIKAALPSLFDLVVQATRGKLAVNKPAPDAE